MFIDEVQIKVISWKWWDGLVSWRREKYIPKWGPRGGNGGNGGDVYLRTEVNINTLSEYRYKKVLTADTWERWGKQNMHGANAEDLILKVPVWTLVKDSETWELLADLSKENQSLLVAKWWRGWYGNSNFCSSTRQAPAFAELGDVCEERDLLLELKLVADIGIIGIPSAGKSTLISKLSNVTPKIGDYPFTTLTPNLGVLDHKWKSLVLEDVPGLIPWAHEWKGLGIEFLKHIERTGVLLHMLDLYRLDSVFTDYTDIRKELELFSDSLLEKEEIIVLSKADLLDAEMKEHIVSEFKKKYADKTIFVISAATGEWIDELKDFLVDNYSKEVIEISEDDEVEEIRIYDLKHNVNPKHVTVTHLWDMQFRAKWVRLEQIVRMTDFDNKEAIMRVYDVMDKLWVIKNVEKQLEKIMKDNPIDNSFFFESEDEDAPEEFTPSIWIGDRQIGLEKLRYNL